MLLINEEGFQHFGVEQGFSSSDVTQILEDKNRVMFFVTHTVFILIKMKGLANSLLVKITGKTRYGSFSRMSMVQSGYLLTMG